MKKKEKSVRDFPLLSKNKSTSTSQGQILAMA